MRSTERYRGKIQDHELGKSSAKNDKEEAEIFRCRRCGRDDFTSRKSVLKHNSYCASAIASKIRQDTLNVHISKQKDKSVKVVHNTSKHSTAAKAAAKKKQKRAVKYSSKCLLKPPTLRDMAREVHKHQRADMESEANAKAQEAIESAWIAEDDGRDFSEFLGSTGIGSRHSNTVNEEKSLRDLVNEDDFSVDEYEENSDPVDYNNNDDDDVDMEDDADEWEDMDEDEEGSLSPETTPEQKWTAFIYGDTGTDWTPPFKYKGNLPSYYKMQAHLMLLLSQHKTNDLSMFDRIMKWAEHWSDRHPRIWKHRKRYNSHRRASTLKLFAKLFDLKDPYPTEKTVECQGGKKVTVPVMDFKSQLLSLVNDPDLMTDDKFIEHNFDPETLRPTKHYDDYTDDDIIDDVNSGYLYHRGIDLYCKDEDKPDDVDMIVPCPIIMYVDECNTDKHGALSVEVVSFTLGFWNIETRRKYDAWRHAGFGPNMGVGLGTNANNYDDDYYAGSKAYRRKHKKDVRSPKDKMIDQQKVYETILESFVDCCNDGGARAVLRGKKCILKPYLLEIIGDAKGQNTICCHFNSCGNKGVACLVKECLCDWEGIASHKPQCHRITREHRARAMKDADFAKSISHHQVESAFNALPLADVIEGVNGQTPFDGLHVHGHGTYVDGAQALKDILGKNDTNKAAKDAFDMLFQHLAYEFLLNSEKRIPRFTYRFGAMDLTRITGMERMGNYLIMLTALNTDRGKEIFRPYLKKIGFSVNMMIQTMELVLAFDTWCAGKKFKWELDNCEDAVSYLLSCIKKYLPRKYVKSNKKSKTPGCNGYHKIKFHAIWLFVNQMRKLGGSDNFDSSYGEEHHRTAVSAPAKQTQRRYATLVSQTMRRDCENNIIRNVCKFIKDDLPDDERNLYTHTSRNVNETVTGRVLQETAKVSGGYKMYCSLKRDGTAKFSHLWYSRPKANARVKISSIIHHALASWCKKDAVNFTGPYEVSGFTSLTAPHEALNITYRCSECFMGKKRYDWALVQDKEDIYITQICGILRFNTPGFPTPKLLDVPGSSPAEIWKNKLVDESLYCVVRASQGFWTEETLMKKIVTPFKMEGNEKIFILPVESIIRPLVVVTNFGTMDRLSFVHVLPKKDWGQIFKRRIEMEMKKNKR